MTPALPDQAPVPPVKAPRPRGRRAGIVGGAVGLVAAGAAVGLAVERYAIGRIRGGTVMTLGAGTGAPTDTPTGAPADASTDAPEVGGRRSDAVRMSGRDLFTPPVPDRVRVVVTADSIPLHVEEDGPADAPLTVVFVHGYCLNLGAWRFQRLGLAEMSNPRLRMVFYDHRSHGRSARAPSETSTIDQLGEDLYELLTEVAPRGPVVLVGHSMGGMTVMALADRHPEMFAGQQGAAGGPRVVGVALLSTSTGRLAEVTLGLPALLARIRTVLMPHLARGMRRRAALVERSRRLAGDVAFLLTRKYSFGSKDVDPALVEYVGAMINDTPVEVIADFLPAITSHEKLAALYVLRTLPTLVMVGDRDLLTPPDHSSAIADQLDDTELVVVEGAGHLAILECPEMVNLHLRAFLHRAARRAPNRRRKA